MEEGQALNGLNEGPWEEPIMTMESHKSEFAYKEGLLNVPSKYFDTDGKTTL